MGLTPVQQETTQELAYTTSIQTVTYFSTNEDVVEGDLLVTDSSGTYRTAVRLVVIKNGLGTYEVATYNLAGDDILGNPLGVFTMSGNALRVTLDGAFSGITKATFTYYIRTPSLYRALPELSNVLVKEDASTYSTSQTGVLNISNLPPGYYRVSIWANGIIQDADGAVVLKPRLGGSPAIPVGLSNIWEIGFPAETAISGEQIGVKNFSDTKYLQVTSLSSFNIDLDVSGTSSSITSIGYSIESMPGFTQIDTQWD